MELDFQKEINTDTYTKIYTGNWKEKNTKIDELKMR